MFGWFQQENCEKCELLFYKSIFQKFDYENFCHQSRREIKAGSQVGITIWKSRNHGKGSDDPLSRKRIQRAYEIGARTIKEPHRISSLLDHGCPEIGTSSNRLFLAVLGRFLSNYPHWFKSFLTYHEQDI